MTSIYRPLSRLRMGLPACALAGLLIAGLAPARAQDAPAAPAVDLTSPLARELLSCAEVEEDAARLDCFDRAAEPLARADREAEEAAVKVLQGEDDWDSEYITIEEPWHVVWTLDGSILTLELRERDGQRRDIVGNQIGSGEGASQVLDPGTWQIAVRAVGPWRVRVVAGPPE